MPYTPPSHRSPATSKPSSPVLTRNHSYSNDRPSSPLVNAAQRPGFSRSFSYSQKHRRSPSISDAGAQDVGKATAQSTAANASMTNGIARNTKIPGSDGTKESEVISPPDSSHSSDDEDHGRSRKLAELQSALHNSMDWLPERRHSPNREEDSRPAAPRSTPALGSVSPALTPEARKIAHSRSSSELNLSKLKPLDDSPIETSDCTESDPEDGALRIKPPLLRKKSGELVKPALRPPSRRRPSSMPGTPTYSKAVHFNEDIVQVRHFLQVDRPIAVSAGSSPVDTYESESEYPFTTMRPKARDVEWEIKLSDFPKADTFERKTMPVRVERLFLSPDKKTLIGEVAVQNLAFHKTVTARFTLDYWKTTSEVQAEYNQDVRVKPADDGCDRFNFNIKLSDQAHLETKTLLLCVRYNVNGQEFWDNNNSTNYQVDFTKKAKARNAKGGMHGLGAGTLGAIPRSRSQQSPQRQARTTPATPDDFDDFSHRFDSSYDFLQKSANRSKSSTSSRNSSFLPDQPRGRSSGTSQGLSNRYDFAASLSAALGSAQSSTTDHTVSKPPASSISASSVPKAGDKTSTPAAISSEKPDLQSAEYNELIQKYCFFGSDKLPGKGSPSTKTPPKPAPPVDGTISESSSENNSAHNSGSNSPSPNSLSPLVDGANDVRSSRTVTPFLSRSASPGPVTGFTPRSTSPGAFPHPYGHQNIHGGLDYHTPTAIRG